MLSEVNANTIGVSCDCYELIGDTAYSPRLEEPFGLVVKYSLPRAQLCVTIY